MLIIDPPLPSASMRAPASRQQYHTPNRFVRTVCSNMSFGSFSGIEPASAAVPALLTRMSIRPHSFPGAGNHCFDLCRICHVAFNREPLTPGRLNLGDDLVQLLHSTGADHDAGSRFGQYFGKRHTEARRCTGSRWRSCPPNSIYLDGISSDLQLCPWFPSRNAASPSTARWPQGVIVCDIPTAKARQPLRPEPWR